MKTISKTYKRLENLMRYNGLRQFSLDQYSKGYIYKSGYILRFRFTPDEDKRVRLLLAKAIVSEKNAQRYADLIERAESCGIFRHVLVCFSGNSIYSTYCAGQDYTSEVRYIQNLLRNN